MTLSKDHKVKNAIKDINVLDTVEAVQAYIAGDNRQDVLDAAKVQIEFIEKTAPDAGAGDQGSGVGKNQTPPPADANQPPAPAAIVSGSGDSTREIKPLDDKDGTPDWIKTLHNLQPKPGEVSELAKKIESTGLKVTPAQKEAVKKSLTILDGVPHWIHFDEDGKQVKTEKVPGH